MKEVWDRNWLEKQRAGSNDLVLFALVMEEKGTRPTKQGS